MLLNILFVLLYSFSVGADGGMYRANNGGGGIYGNNFGGGGGDWIGFLLI